MGQDIVPFNPSKVQWRGIMKDAVTLGFKRSKAIGNDPNRVEVAFYQSGFLLQKADLNCAG